MLELANWTGHTPGVPRATGPRPLPHGRGSDPAYPFEPSTDLTRPSPRPPAICGICEICGLPLRPPEHAGRMIEETCTEMSDATELAPLQSISVA